MRRDPTVHRQRNGSTVVVYDLDDPASAGLVATGQSMTLEDGTEVPMFHDPLAGRSAAELLDTVGDRLDDVDPENVHAPFAHAWADLAATSEAPVHAYTAALLARAVDAVRVGGTHTQERYVPEVMRRICVLLEDLGLGADTTVRLEADVEDLVRVLVAELNAETRAVVHNRLQTDLAATLIPRLSGGTKS